MAITKHPRLWTLWLIFLCGGVLALAYVLAQGQDKRLFMPGPLSHGHHQIAQDCQACHTSAFSDATAMDEQCVACHGDQRQKPLDSHPKTKFTDPRNADRLANIDVLQCVTCHQEHKTELILDAGYTQPVDFCVHCHADIGENRPSHEGMGFETCNSAGCHNYHNNRALYTDYLLRHADQPAMLAHPRLPKRDFVGVLDLLVDYPLDRYPVQQLSTAEIDAPESQRQAAIDRDWLETAHAAAGVNCSGCHGGDEDDWNAQPDHQVCADCHDAEVAGFLSGLHGMRLASDLPPMTPAEARLPMQDASAHLSLTCTSCHAAHRFETQTAAVDACLTCHADDHSLAFKDSPHGLLWQQALAGELEASKGVSCATCHLPRVEYEPNDWSSRILVQHNQSATLRPNEKMLRPVCQHCHGLGFAMDALADPALIHNNFTGQPAVKIQSIQMALDDDARARAELEASQ